MSRSRRHQVLALALSLVLNASISAIAPVALVRADTPCGDVLVIYARGSTYQPNGSDFQAFYGSDAHPTAGIVPHVNRNDVAINSYQLGDNGGYGGFRYDAVGDIATLASSVLPFLPGSAYANSVAQGVGELHAYLADRAAACPGEVYVLGGWSQGAQVVGTALEGLDRSVRDRIAYTALFGDPKLDTGNVRAPFGTTSFWSACTPATSSPPWKRWDDCAIAGGYLEARTPYVPDDMRLRVGSWCEEVHPLNLPGAGDGVCDGFTGDLIASTFGLLGQPHYHAAYLQPGGGMDQAAVEVAETLQVFLPAHAASFDTSRFALVGGPAGADLAIVFDTTGSMWNAIADAQAQATAVAQQWLTFFPGGRVALVDFKDQGDPYVARVDLGLTGNIGDFQNAVNQLTATGGGDTPEAQLSGVMAALDGLDWKAGATKAEIVITDAPGKDPEPVTGYTRDQVAQHAREIDPVAVYGVNVGTDQSATDFFGPLTAGTAGQVLVVQPGQTLGDALFAVLNIVHLKPVATLNDAYIGETGTAIHFSAEGSFDPDGELVSYEWDFDNDGTVDATTTDPFVDHLYPGDFNGVASVRVVSSDGGSAIATATVRVMTEASLAALMPAAPTSAAASATGPSQVTLTWTPAASDRAVAYLVTLADGTPLAGVLAADPHSVVVDGVDLGSPVSFRVVAQNDYGNSAAAETAPVGGAGWGPSVRVNDVAGSAISSAPSVALGPDGAGYAVWPDSRGTSQDVYSSRRDQASGAWSANVRVNDDTGTARQSSPRIAVDGSGNAYGVWDDTRNGATNSDIYFSKRPSGSGIWGANLKVNDDTQTALQIAPSIGVTSSGVATSIWIDLRKNKRNLCSSTLPAGGSAWAANLQITGNQTSNKASPDLAVGADGTAYAAWADDRNGNNDIYFSKLTPGGVWSANVKVSDDPDSARQEQPSVAVDAAGNVLVIWVDYRSGDYNSGLAEVRASRLAAGTSTWSASVAVADATSKPLRTDLAIRPDGRALAVWEDAATGQYEIRSSERDPSSGSWTAPVAASEVPGSDLDPQVAYSTSQALLVYQNGSDIYARRSAN